MDRREPSFFCIKKNGDFEGRILWEVRFSLIKVSNSHCCPGESGYILQSWGLAPGTSSIVWSYMRWGGSSSKPSFRKMSANSYRWWGTWFSGESPGVSLDLSEVAQALRSTHRTLSPLSRRGVSAVWSGKVACLRFQSMIRFIRSSQLKPKNMPVFPRLATTKMTVSFTRLMHRSRWITWVMHSFKEWLALTSSFRHMSLLLGMFSSSTRCLSIRDPDNPLSMSILRGKEESQGIIIVICRSSCFSPVSRTHGVRPWHFVVR